MLLTGLDINGSVRFRDVSSGSEIFDYEIGIFDKGAGKINATFGDLFYYMLPSGAVTGVDDTTNNITTGFFVNFYDVSNNLIGSTAVGKIDKYETETHYVYKVTGSLSLTSLASDTYVARIEILYRGNNGGTANDIVIINSDSPKYSAFAQTDANGNKGIHLIAGDNVDLSYDLVIRIAKNQ